MFVIILKIFSVPPEKGIIWDGREIVLQAITLVIDVKTNGSLFGQHGKGVG